MKFCWRLIYQILYLLSIPYLAYQEKTKHFKSLSFKLWLKNKLGFSNFPNYQSQSRIWVHGVSMGEINTGILFIKKWLDINPNHQIVFTTHTRTGRDSAIAFANNSTYKSKILVELAPFDLTSSVNNFIEQHKFMALILIESDLWPATSWVCNKRELPIYIINARMSPKTESKIQKFKKIGIQNLWDKPNLIIAQNPDQAIMWQQIGSKVVIGGQLKYDLEVPVNQIKLGDKFIKYLKQNSNKKVLLFASTREGEELIALKIWKALGIDFRKNFNLVIVPRHLSRVNQIVNLIKDFNGQNFQSQLRSSMNDEFYQDQNIWIGDSLAEMFAYYQLADLVVIGGSLLSYGGQNPIEAFAIGVPLIFGPYTYNFTQVREEAIINNAAFGIDEKDNLIAKAVNLIITISQDEKIQKNMIENQKKLIFKNQGSISKTIEILQKENFFTRVG